MLVPWQARIKRDVSVIEDAVHALDGGHFEEAIRQLVTHQLERLVVDVVVVTRMEEMKKQ